MTTPTDRPNLDATDPGLDAATQRVTVVLTDHGPDFFATNQCRCGAVIHDDSQFRSHLADAVARAAREDVAEIVREGRAEAWDEGFYRGAEEQGASDGHLTRLVLVENPHRPTSPNTPTGNGTVSCNGAHTRQADDLAGVVATLVMCGKEIAPHIDAALAKAKADAVDKANASVRAELLRIWSGGTLNQLEIFDAVEEMLNQHAAAIREGHEHG